MRIPSGGGFVFDTPHELDAVDIPTILECPLLGFGRGGGGGGGGSSSTVGTALYHIVISPRCRV